MSLLSQIRASTSSCGYTAQLRARAWRNAPRGFQSLSSQASQADIDPSQLEVVSTPENKTIPPSETLKFGQTFTDHMLTIPWSTQLGWGKPQIVPYGPIELDPGASVLHYATTVFEGMKAYRDTNGRVTMFRPDMNMKRMNTSAARIALPTFDGPSLLQLIKELIRLDKQWIPTLPGYSLYIRPTMIGTHKYLGVGPPDEALIFVILSPVGPYYPKGFKPISLWGTTEYIRAAPGGTGAFKVGVNYAAATLAQKHAHKLGYDQNLWLHGPEHYLTEVGTMNAFIAFSNADGSYELVTPPLDGMILPGVTRDSVLTLAREHTAGVKRLQGLDKNIVVSERPVTMKEVKEAAKVGRLVEFFGSGTAVIISPVDKIGYLGEDIAIPTGDDGMGPISRAIFKELNGRQVGTIPSDWSVVVA